MKLAHLPYRGGLATARALRMPAFAALLLGCVLHAPIPALAAPFIWDQDGDGIDDRIETVNILGYQFSFENGDTLSGQRFEVVRHPGGLEYGIYVVYDHDPTASDLATLTSMGIPVLHRYEGVTAVRALANFARIQSVAALSGVRRVEAVPILYPEVHEGVASIGVRDPSQQVFPSWAATGGGNGTGVVIAFLDTGVNDEADGTYAGHESLAGRCLGGAEFDHGDSLLDTPRDGSVNPEDRGGLITRSHGTHVAGIAIGSGGASGYATGVAPGARFVDVKVLNDLGTGTGVGEGLDWCIHNRVRSWGVPGYAGIQVVNLSLASLDSTDGNDLVSQLADRAVDLGMVVVAAIGNGGRDHFVPSPAGANRALAVGAMDDQRTARPEDDLWASFNDFGPRANDGDSNPYNEQKPDLLAPGVAVLSADGSLATDGTQYHRLSGTSMSAAFVSGVVAALRSDYPALSPDAIAELLRATARRDLAGVPAGVTGPDPRWRSTIGFGIVDLYAARLEMEQPSVSQIVQLELGSTDSTITATLRTQRERGAAWFVFERAPDTGNAPGAFTPCDSVAAAGDSSLASAVNRHPYVRTWAVPPAELGQAFWYRVAETENGVRHVSPARRYVSPVGPPIATIELTVVHDAYDHDVTGMIYAGGTPIPFSAPLPGSSAAVSSDWVSGESTTGTVSWSFRIQVPPGAVSVPSSSQPWWLRVDEGGYINRSGRVTQFDVIWHGSQGDVACLGGPLPIPTIEGQSTYSQVPQATLAVDRPTSGAKVVRYGPNPVIAGSSISFAISRATPTALEILDINGRAVARIPFRVSSAGSFATWETRDREGHPLRPGIYLARYGARDAVRIAVIRP